MGVTFVTGPAVVRVPATSANLGPGFDALGLALGLYDEVTARVTDGGYRVEVTGAGAGELPTDDRHLVVQAMLTTFDALGGRPAGLALHCLNRIPQARGLGSSSAAIVAGVLLARALVTDGAQRLDAAGALRIAAAIEGHPDNVAPCLLGGFTIAWTEPTATTKAAADDPGAAATAATADPTATAAGTTGAAATEAAAVATAEAAQTEAATAEAAAGAGVERVAAGAHLLGTGGGARAVRLAPASAVQPTVFVPEERGLTAVARAALPAAVPHRDAAFNAGRAALLVHALTAEPGLLLAATEDRLHQEYRAPGMPDSAELVAGLRAAGVAAVVSGAGPTVLALTAVPDGFDPGPGWSVSVLPVDGSGALVEGGRLGHAERDPVAAGRMS